MPEDRSHHITKRRQYDLLLVPSDDTGKAKGVRLAPWQIVSVLVGAVLLIVGAVLLVLIYTPLGPLVPIPNPELENRYNRELLALNERMSGVMQQLVELRAYNVKLRRALGENVTLTDSGVVSTGAQRQAGLPSRAQQHLADQRPQDVPTRQSVPLSRPVAEQVRVESQQVVFPVIMPTEGYVTRTFNPNQRHFGIDIAGKIGTPVNAAAEGYVIFAGWTNEDGNLIILSHAGGFLTFYKHNQSLLKPANSFVKRGEPIALLGNSGISSGPHLHFEIWKDGSPVDPANYVIKFNF
ncbi:MAG TPA: M23 family metallopeptidase [Bacteroidota bacterium]|nr:M23 family metallopeptidase [Bacteroidota bacterium]